MLGDGPGRRREAGIPGGLEFATKPELAIAQLERLMAAGLPVLWAAADEVYGRCGELPGRVRGLGLAYVSSSRATSGSPSPTGTVIRADQAVSGRGVRAAVVRERVQGTPLRDWALIATADPREFLLIRRLISRPENQYTFYLCWAPEGRPATMTYFITIAGRRWPVEETFKTGKDALGWDQSQARTWDAICRHTALAALAQLRTAAIRAALPATSPSPPPRRAGPTTAARTARTPQRR